MNIWQVWLIVGVPSLALALACFVHSSRTASLVGFAVLALGGAGVMAASPPSGAVFGGVLALLYAAGRGSGEPPATDDRYPRQT